MKNKTCCFTGHRDMAGSFRKLKKSLKKTITELIEKGIVYFGNGGALGFDTLAALTVLELRKKYPQIKLIMVLPCRDQSECWSEEDKKIYSQILDSADKVVYTSEKYYPGCMHKRNRHLVDSSAVCVCYYTGRKSGTAYTVGYAKRKKLEIINISQGRHAAPITACLSPPMTSYFLFFK